MNSTGPARARFPGRRLVRLAHSRPLCPLHPAWFGTPARIRSHFLPHVEPIEVERKPRPDLVGRAVEVAFEVITHPTVLTPRIVVEITLHGRLDLGRKVGAVVLVER